MRRFKVCKSHDRESKDGPEMSLGLCSDRHRCIQNSQTVRQLEAENDQLRKVLEEMIKISDRKHIVWDKAKKLLEGPK